MPRNLTAIFDRTCPENMVAPSDCKMWSEGRWGGGVAILGELGGEGGPSGGVSDSQVPLVKLEQPAAVCQVSVRA